MNEKFPPPGPEDLDPYEFEGRTVYVPFYYSGIDTEWRYRPYGVIDEAVWMRTGAVAFDLTREVTGGQGTDRYL